MTETSISTHTVEMLDTVQKLVARMKPILAGQDRLVQDIVLADLLATWIAGHSPEARDDILAAHIELVRSLIPHNEREVFGDAGHPGRDAEPSLFEEMK